MNDLEAFRRFGLDRLNVSVFSETWVDFDINPAVGCFFGNDNIFGQSHNEIGSDVPLVLVLELTGRRHIGDIALLRTAIDPLHERGDLFLRERSIVLEMANAYVLIDVPGWHLASESFLLDCF